MSKYKLCRGFKDLMPTDYKKYDFLKKELESVSNTYGYKMVDTCFIEESNLYKDCFDEDISNHLFEIEGRFTNHVSLTYDNTISILRSIVENKLYVDKSLPLKFMYCKEKCCYDKKKPSESNKCEFGFECVGDKSVYLDVENVLVNMRILSYLGLSCYNLKIANFGEDNEYYDTFKQTLSILSIDYEEDDSINKRDYYSGIAFEIDIDEYNGVISGGRYDHLINVIGGVSVGAVGSRIDFDTLVKIIDEKEGFPTFNEEVDFYIIPKSKNVFKYALYVSEMLREIGAFVQIHYKEYDLRRLDDLLERIDVTYSIVIDEEDEINSTIKVRNALIKNESTVLLKDFISDLEKLDEHHHEREE